MKKHIVCLGDSNTHGYCADIADCADGAIQRFNEAERWTCRLQAALGADYLVLEEGLGGRTSVFQDPLGEGLAAIDYIRPCLLSHAPVALLIVMLGTNDTKERFGASPACISLGLERLVRTAQGIDCWGGGVPNILLLAPPVIGPRMETSPVGGCMGAGCVEKSRLLPPLLEASAKRTGCHFMNAGGCEFNRVDYMHLTKLGHAQLADRLTALVPTLVN